MPVHKVTMTLPAGIVLNSDIEFEILSDEVKIGELHLSKGTLDWRPAHSKKTEHSLKWEAFAKLMEEQVKPRKH